MHAGFLHLNPTFQLYYKLAELLKAKHGIRFSGVVTAPDAERAIRAINSSTFENINMSNFMAQGWHTWDTSNRNLERIEAKYGTPYLWYLINADRVIRDWPLEEIKKVVVATVAFWEHYADRFRPDVFICGGVAHLSTFLGYQVLNANGIPFMTFSPGKVKGRFYLSKRVETHQFDGLEDEYERIKSEGLTPDERQKASRFVDGFRGKPTAPLEAINKKFRLPSLIGKRNYLGHIRNLVSAHFDREYQNAVKVGNARTYSQIIAAEMQRAVNWNLYRMLGIFENAPQEPEPYFYYGLHFQPEATTLVNGQYWTNQIALIENIARSMPITHRLYVKEHRVTLGTRPVSYYQAIRRIPNVRLISPFVDSHYLTKNAEIVLSISGTIGWEAILFGKPLVVFGEVFYKNYSRAVSCKNIEELPHVLKRFRNQAPATDEELLQFVAAILNVTHPGFTYVMDARTFESDNLELVANQLYEKALVPINR